MSASPWIPARWLFAALAANLALAALALWIALAQPWLGLSLAADGKTVLVSRVAPDGPAARAGLAPGTRLLALAPPGGAPLPLTARDLIEEPDTIDEYADMAAFFARQSTLREWLRAPLRLYWHAPEGGATRSLDVVPAARPWHSLPPVFWFQLFAGMTASMIGAWVLALRPADWGVRMFALTGLMLLTATWPAAIYSTRELAIDGGLFRALSALNHGGAIFFGCGLVGLFLCYPRALVRPRTLLWLPAVSVPWLFADIFRVAPDLTWGARLPIMGEMLLAMGFALWQWFSSKGRPIDRAALRWLGLSAITGCGLFVFSTVGMQLLGAEQPLSQGYSFGFFLIMYAGLALGLGRYRLFELDRWAYRVLLWVGGAFAILLLDTLLIAAFPLGAAPALGLALLAGGWLYFPLRQWLWRRLIDPSRRDPAELLPEVVRIAFSAAPGAREAEWEKLLRALYAPLETSAEAAPHLGAPRIEEGGLAMLVPGSGGLAARRLRYPGRGARLFSPADAEYLAALGELMARAAAGRDAREEGAARERRRIARDMHDDIGARLLMLIHRAKDRRDAEIARAAMQDLRSTLNALEAAPAPLEEVLADWRTEIDGRCETAGVESHWRLPPECAALVLSPRERTTLEKVLRETVTNALKHARPSYIELTLRQEENGLHLRVEHDGAAVPPAQWREGRGLRNMRTRLHEQGGFWQADAPAAGIVRARFSLPLEAGAGA